MCNFQTIPGEIFQVFVKFRQTFGPFQKAQLFGVSYTQIPSPSCITTFMMTMTPKYTRKTFLHLIVPNVCTLSLAAAVRKWAEASNCNSWDKLPKCGEFSRAAAATQPMSGASGATEPPRGVIQKRGSAPGTATCSTAPCSMIYAVKANVANI